MSSGFTFGGGAPTPATNAPTLGSSTAGGFSFGGTSTATTTAALTNTNSTTNATTNSNSITTSGGGFSFGGTVPSAPAAATSTSSANTQQQQVEPVGVVPEFKDAFPELSIQSRINDILSILSTDDEADGEDETVLLLQGQELMHLLSTFHHEGKSSSESEANTKTAGTILSKPKPLECALPNASLRQKLQPPSASTVTAPAAHVMLHSKLTPLLPSIVNDILTLSDELKIDEMHAASLYSAASSRDVNVRGWLRSKDGNSLTAWKGRNFWKESVNAAKRNGTYVSNTSSATSNTNFTDAKMEGDDDDNAEDEENVLDIARELYFRNQASILQTILMLVKHRVSASTHLTNSHNDSHHFGWKMILEATDQLLRSDLIANLMELIREMTQKNLELEKKICSALDASVSAFASASPGGFMNTATPTGFGGFVGFGSSVGTTPQSQQQQPQTPTIQINDVDYALYAFTFQQRQIASECLFYLAYHTQCTSTEVASLIDLVKDLSNGDSGTGASSSIGGIGGGLRVLDAIRDVPDPFSISSSENGGGIVTGSNDVGGMWDVQQQQQQRHQDLMSQPTTAVVEKDHADWEEELVTSLWSVKGLKDSTITSKSMKGGQTVYTSSNLASILSSSEGSGDVVVGGGMPQLLQCVSTLILAVICALDGRNVLMDRGLHGPNAFGVGNALFQPSSKEKLSSTPTLSLEPIHSRLDPNREGYTSWKRQDIVGLLSAAYALLLSPSASLISSSQTSSQHTTGFGSSPSIVSTPENFRDNVTRKSSIDIKTTFRSCLEIPTINKSISFARLSLLPCLGKASTKPASSNLDTDFAFYVSVVSDFTAQYLDAICAFGELPISRAKWLSDEQQELQLRQVQEEQRRQFGAFYGQPYQEVQLPNEVDITKRPDCLDDVIALAVAVCYICPDSAGRFWSVVESQVADGDQASDGVVMQLKPSRIVKKLERLQADDASLLPCYLSLLAAISLADSPNDSKFSKNGATAVHDWLSNMNGAASSPTSPNSSDSSQRVNWVYILNFIRWYANELSPPESTPGLGTRVSSADNFRRSASSNNEYEDSTAYYYGAESNAKRFVGQSRQQAISAGQPNSSNTGPETKRELDEGSALNLLSLLSLLSQVAVKSDVARSDILSIKLQEPGNNSNFAVIEDDALTVLFSLVTASISPNIRGLVLTAIANLIRCDNLGILSKDRRDEVIDVGNRGWELLESCQIIPIALLAQYTPLQDDINAPVFPPVSLTASSSVFMPKNQASKSSFWFPSSDRYGIINEMEHIESKTGSYPSTEGVLKLLTALISTVGCPPKLGAKWRPRPGCSPYIEFVIDFVLPRAMGTRSDDSGLYFATPADKCRLLTHSLEVIDAVLTNYSFRLPPQSNTATSSENALNKFLVSKKDAKSSQNLPLSDLNHSHLIAHEQKSIDLACKQYGFSLVRSSIFPSQESINTSSSEIDETVRDFRDDNIKMDHPASPTTEFGISTNTYQLQHTQHFTQSSPSQTKMIPRAKTPGFSILASILSASRSSLFEILAQILILDQDASGIHTLYGETVLTKAVVAALFGDTKPNYLGAKIGRDYALQQTEIKGAGAFHMSAMPTAFIQSMMHTLCPPAIENTRDKKIKESKRFIVAADDAVRWREHSILLSLRILCAAAAREKTFALALNSAPEALNLIPVLRFQSPASGSFINRGLIVKNLHLSRLSNLLLGTMGSSNLRDLIPIIAQYIGYQTISLQEEEAIAEVAMCLVSYVCKQASHREYVSALCGRGCHGQADLAVSIATRLSFGSKSSTFKSKESVQNLILTLLLSNLQLGTVGDQNLSHVVLGLSGNALKEQKDFLLKPSQQMQHFNYRSNYNGLDAIVDLISDVKFVLNPLTSSLASKCYELIYRLIDFHHGNQSLILSEWLPRVCVMSKLRRLGFWETHLIRFLDKSESSFTIFRMTLAQSPLNKINLFDSDLLTIARDNEVLHCISWLLKSVAIELHSLMGLDSPTFNSDSFISSGLLRAAAPKLSHCYELLSLLYGKSDSIVIQTLSDLTLMKPNIIRTLGADTPPESLIQSLSEPLEGPVDVCSGYEVINLENVTSTIENGLDPLKDNIFKWAERWNAYVSFTCASSHLASSWSLLLRGSISSCRPLLFFGESNIKSASSGLLDQSTIVDLLAILLSRMNTNQYQLSNTKARDKFKNASFEQYSSSKSELEPSSVLPLSISALSLVDVVLQLNASIVDTTQNKKFFVEAHELLKILNLILSAIGCCDNHVHNERAAILCCSLSAILTSKLLTNCNNLISSSFINDASEAATILLRLSGLSNYDYGSKDEKPNAISCAARSALSALLTWFDSQNKKVNENPGTQNFLLELFPSQHGIEQHAHTYMSRLIQLISKFDTDIAFLLESFASCHGGTELLVNLGLTDALVSAASDFSIDAGIGSNKVRSKTCGSAQIVAPNFLLGHLCLINTLLSSSSPENTRQRLLFDAAKFIRLHAISGECLLQSYPRNADLTKEFIKCLYLTSTGFADVNNNATSNFTGENSMNKERTGNAHTLVSALGHDVLTRLELLVIDLAFHIAEFPFPSKYLPPFPSQLCDMQNRRMTKSNHLSMSLSDGRSWWDSIEQDTSRGNEIDAFCLPNPPTGVIDENVYKRISDSRSELNAAHGWSRGKYIYALSASRVLDLCLMFLSRQVNTPGYNLKIDDLSMGKALCRCADVSRAIEDKLKGLRISDTIGISKMLKMTNMADSSDGTIEYLMEMKLLERRILEELGPMLGRCAEKLLDLALGQFHMLCCIDSGVRAGDWEVCVNQAIEDFVMIFSATLDHTQIETIGIGCEDVNWGGEDESKKKSSNKQIATVLRKDMRKTVH